VFVPGVEEKSVAGKAEPVTQLLVKLLFTVCKRPALSIVLVKVIAAAVGVGPTPVVEEIRLPARSYEYTGE
jgi:hypothetical protein